MSVLAPEVIEPAPLSVHAIIPLEEVAPLTVAVPFWQIVWLPPAVAVGEPFTITEYVAIAGVQGLLETVMVKVTVFPASPAAAVYVGVRVLAPEVIDPAPLSVHAIVPLDDVAPLTVAVAF